jgi:tetratricopeptide (TPR) repeat protein
MNLKLRLASVLLVAFAAGCAHKNQQTASAPPTEFDQVKDPPIHAKTHFAAGQLAESQGQPDRAVRQYEMALNSDPKYADPLFRLGIVYTQLQDYPKAIETWNKYITLTKGSANGYANLGYCEELAGDPLAAEGAYRKGIAREATNEACHMNFGLMLARHNRPNEALLQLQIVLPPAKAHYDLASVYETLHRTNDAKAEYSKALELDPSLDDAKSRLATLSTTN